MANRPLLARPPLAEAVIVMRLDSKIPPDILSHVAVRLQSRYPVKRRIKRAIMTAEVEPAGGKVAFSHEIEDDAGFRLEMIDGLAVVAIEPDGIALARLAPYLGWASLRQEASRVWEEFRALVPEPGVIRVAIRYVNRFPVPVGTFSMEDYFTMGPANPPIPHMQNVAGFRLQLLFPQPDLDALLIFNQSSAPVEKDVCPGVYLDYDLGTAPRSVPVPDEEIWSILDALHERQGDLFLATLTEHGLREIS